MDDDEDDLYSFLIPIEREYNQGINEVLQKNLTTRNLFEETLLGENYYTMKSLRNGEEEKKGRGEYVNLTCEMCMENNVLIPNGDKMKLNQQNLQKK